MRFVSTLLALFLAGSAGAATLYVARHGNDRANGSAKKPLRTITRAAELAKAGDVVNVRRGTYYDRVSIYSRGTEGARIVFRAMPGEAVVLDGSRLRSGQPIVELSRTRYVDFSGFEVRNSSNIGIVVWHARQTRILDNHVHHTERNGIYAGGDEMPANSDLTLSRNRVHDTVLENRNRRMQEGGWAGAIVLSKTVRATVTGNTVWNNHGEGLIALRSIRALIRENEIFDNFSAYLYLDNAREITADRNLLYSTGDRRFFRDGKPAAGIAVANENKDVTLLSRDNVFTNNVVIGTRWGFYYGNYESGGGLRNTRVAHNTFHATVDEIIRIENDTHTGSVIENNTFWPTGSPVPRAAGGGRVTFRNNSWYGGNAGAAAGEGDVVAPKPTARLAQLEAAMARRAARTAS